MMMTCLITLDDLVALRGGTGSQDEVVAGAGVAALE